MLLHSIASVSGDQYCIPLNDIVFSEKIIDVWNTSQQLSTAEILGVTAMLLHFNKLIYLPLDDIDSIIHNYISTHSAEQGGTLLSVNGEAYIAHKRPQVKVPLLFEVLRLKLGTPRYILRMLQLLLTEAIRHAYTYHTPSRYTCKRHFIEERRT